MLPMFKIQPAQNGSHFENFIAANEKHVHCKISSEVIEWILECDGKEKWKEE